MNLDEIEHLNHKVAGELSEPGTPSFRIIAWGAVYASVCTGLAPFEATERLNRELPTGISSRWRQADDPTFASGEPNPFPCPDNVSHTHYLFSC